MCKQYITKDNVFHAGTGRLFWHRRCRVGFTVCLGMTSCLRRLQAEGEGGCRGRRDIPWDGIGELGVPWEMEVCSSAHRPSTWFREWLSPRERTVMEVRECHLNWKQPVNTDAVDCKTYTGGSFKKRKSPQVETVSFFKRKKQSHWEINCTPDAVIFKIFYVFKWRNQIT